MNNRTPFIARFAEEIAPSAGYGFRYDAERQISQTLINENWCDTIDADGILPGRTKVTEVSGETTDDR